MEEKMNLDSGSALLKCKNNSGSVSEEDFDNVSLNTSINNDKMPDGTFRIINGKLTKIVDSVPPTTNLIKLTKISEKNGSNISNNTPKSTSN